MTSLTGCQGNFRNQETATHKSTHIAQSMVQSLSRMIRIDRQISKKSFPIDIQEPGFHKKRSHPKRQKILYIIEQGREYRKFTHKICPTAAAFGTNKNDHWDATPSWPIHLPQPRDASSLEKIAIVHREKGSPFGNTQDARIPGAPA